MTDAQRLADAISALVERINKRSENWTWDGDPDGDPQPLFDEAAAALTTAVEIGRAVGREEAAKLIQSTVTKYKAEKPMLSGNAQYDLAINAAMAGIEELESNTLTAIRSATPALDVEALTETVARAICRAGCGNDPSVPAFVDKEWNLYIDEATAVLRSLGIGDKE